MKSGNKTSLLRAAVLDYIAQAQAFDETVRASDIVEGARAEGFTAADFQSYQPSDYDLHRAVDRALQYHRRAGRLKFDQQRGWLDLR
jgi:hypothetical protein